MFDVSRFWKRVAIKEPAECWEWTGARGLNYHKEKSYGHVNYNGKTTKSHRIAWMIYNGPIPDGMFILHKCDNPPCCNPAHLFLGTAKDNMQDCLAKNRVKRTGKRCGEGCPFSKLTSEDVIEIRKAYDSKCETTTTLAARYGMDPSSIGDIVSGYTWKHVGGPIRPRRIGKLRDDVVLSIFKESKMPGASQPKIAKRYGIHFNTVNKIARRLTHRSVLDMVI